MRPGIAACLMGDEPNALDLNRINIPWTILASLWYLLKLISFFSGAVGEGRVEGLPSRQNVRSVRYKPDSWSDGFGTVRSGLFTKERDRWWACVPQPAAVLAVVPCMIREFPQAFQLQLVLLVETGPGLLEARYS